jgi:hypothetical protein
MGRCLGSVFTVSAGPDLPVCHQALVCRYVNGATFNLVHCRIRTGEPHTAWVWFPTCEPEGHGPFIPGGRILSLDA